MFLLISSLIFSISTATFQCLHPGKNINTLNFLNNSNMLRRLGQCLRGTPQILGHLQGLPGPVPVPVHSLAPADPDSHPPVLSWSCHPCTQSCCEQKMGCVVMATSVMKPFWPTLHHDTVTGRQPRHYRDTMIWTFLLFIHFEGINVKVRLTGTFYLFIVCKIHLKNLNDV